MTLTGEVDHAAALPARGAPRRRRARGLLAAAVGTALVVAGGYWWTHPKAFDDLGGSYGIHPKPLDSSAVSVGLVFPKVEGGSESLTLLGAAATFSRNSAAATTEVFICHLSAGESPIGMVADPSGYCTDIEPLTEGTEFRWGAEPDSDYLFVTISPTRPGVSTLESVELTYRRGADHLFQHGTQAIRADVTVSAT